MAIEIKEIESIPLSRFDGNAYTSYFYNGKIYYKHILHNSLTEYIFAIDVKTGERTIAYTNVLQTANMNCYLFGVNEYLYAVEFFGYDGAITPRVTAINLLTNIRQVTNVNIKLGRTPSGGGWNSFGYQNGNVIGVGLWYDATATRVYYNLNPITVNGFTVTQESSSYKETTRNDFIFTSQRTYYFDNGVCYNVGGQLGRASTYSTDIIKYELNGNEITITPIKSTSLVAGTLSYGCFKYLNNYYFSLTNSDYLWIYDTINDTFENSGLNVNHNSIRSFADGAVSQYAVLDSTLLDVVLMPSDYTIRILNNDGSVVHLTSPDNSAIKSVEFLEANNLITYKITTLTSVVEGTYTAIPPEKKRVSGYAYIPNSNKPNINVGVNLNISIDNSVDFYEVYGIYNPPTTTFSIDTYQNSSEPNRVDKNPYLTPIGTIQGALRDETSITKMSIIIESTTVPNFNYVVIPIFNRYYFVTDVSSIRYNLWEISLEVDVLMSYKDGIISQTAFVERNENTYNSNLIDKKRVIEQGYDVNVITVPNEVLETDRTYVLTGFGLKDYTKE